MIPVNSQIDLGNSIGANGVHPEIAEAPLGRPYSSIMRQFVLQVWRDVPRQSVIAASSCGHGKPGSIHRHGNLLQVLAADLQQIPWRAGGAAVIDRTAFGIHLKVIRMQMMAVQPGGRRFAV